MTHLSRQRKRKLEEIPIVAASEVGRAQTEEVIPRGCRTSHKANQVVSKTVWKVRRHRVIAPYAKTKEMPIGT